MLLQHAGDLFAVIDIGSNSIRLVVYDGKKRSPVPMFNEKVLCGLAKGLDETGKLHKEGAKKALTAIGRFVLLSRNMGVDTLHLFATSAVRDATDGPNFVKKIEDSHQLSVETISGEQEAILAAKGVLSSMVGTDGVIGDLGGGSLELVELHTKNVGTGESYPIGPLRFDMSTMNKDKQVAEIDRHIAASETLENLTGKTFYAVGGAFRNIAKLHMHRVNYPLRVIHNYSIQTEEFLSTLRIVSRMSEAALSRIPDISKRRLEFLPFAARIIERIIYYGSPRKIVFSSHGVREGYLYDTLSATLKNQDVLLAGCRDMIRRVNRHPRYGKELAGWLLPLFPNLKEKDIRIIKAACILSEASCYEHNEYRGELAYKRIVDSSLSGISHKERVFLAAILYSRYCSSLVPDELGPIYSILSTARKEMAQAVGRAMRLGKNISGGSLDILPGCAIHANNDKLILTIGKKFTPVAGEAVSKRMLQLADALGMEPKIIIQ